MSKTPQKVKKPKDDIWMPLYIGDYLGSTSRLTTEQHGAYLLLIMDYFKSGPLPDNDQILCQITRMSPDAWSNASSILKAFFKASDGKLFSQRIDKEREEAKARVEKWHNRAVNAANTRWGINQDATSNATSIPNSNANAMLEDMLEQCHHITSQHTTAQHLKTLPYQGGDRLLVDEDGCFENPAAAAYLAAKNGEVVQ